MLTLIIINVNFRQHCIFCFPFYFKKKQTIRYCFIVYLESAIHQYLNVSLTYSWLFTKFKFKKNCDKYINKKENIKTHRLYIHLYNWYYKFPVLSFNEPRYNWNIVKHHKTSQSISKYYIYHGSYELTYLN